MARYAATLEWEEVTVHGDSPHNRWGSAHCVVGDKVFISGGCFSSGNSEDKSEKYRYYADAWYLQPHGDTFKWLQLPDPPETFKPRFLHSATLVGNLIWIVGGHGNGKKFDDVFTFNIETHNWTRQRVRMPPFVQRSGHCSISLPNEPHKILLFGGSFPENDDNPRPTLVLLDTKLLTVSELHTFGDGRRSRTWPIAFRISETKILFVGGADLEKKLPIEGAACLDIEKRTWKEKQLTDPCLVNLIGARGVRFQCKNYIHGGKYMDNNERYSSDIIEIGSGLLPPHCDIRRIRSHGIEGMTDHLLFLSGDWIYACLGKMSQNGEETKVYRANLTKMEESISLALPTSPPVFDLTAENEETAMIIDSPSWTAKKEVRQDCLLSEGTDESEPAYRFINSRITKMACEPASSDAGMSGGLRVQMNCEAILSLHDAHATQEMDQLKDEVKILKRRLEVTSNERQELEKELKRLKENEKKQLESKDAEIERLQREVASAKSEFSNLVRREKAWLESSPVRFHNNPFDP